MGVKQEVYAYLDQNNHSTISDIVNAFPDYNKITLSNYLSRWRKANLKPHTPRESFEGKSKPTTGPNIKSKRKKDDFDPMSDYTLVETLKATIQAQQLTIDTMVKQNELIKQSQQEMFSILSDLSNEKLMEVKELVNIFLKGLKQN